MAITQTFSEFTLIGTNLQNPTSLQFGPDGRLYVSQQNGLIKVYDVTKVGDTWQASNEKVIDLVNQIPNHDDMGNLEANVNNRQVTGLVVAGTAENPILYVSSSDPRIGAGGGGQDENLDTNSGIISRLTLNESGEWEKVDLVIGLPRSEENHSTNGMDIRTESVEVSPGVFELHEIMYVQSGGHDNKGAPSNNFAYTPEYYYSAGLLRIDLTQLAEIEADLVGNGGLNGGTDYVDEYVYALPTLDDPTRTNNSEVTGDGALDSANGTTGAVDFEAADTFGGNDGRNQAKYDEDGPVQVYSPGYRNAYDVVITEAGNIYTFDNGPNNNWGGDVVDDQGNEVTSQSQVATNAPNLNDNTNDGDPDNLHIVQEGTYGGHPNPTRASGEAAGLWSGQGGGLSADVQLTPAGSEGNDPATVWDDLPEDWNTITGQNTNPIEGVYFGPDNSPGPQDESLLSINSSSNGLTEYTADNIGDGGPGVEYLAVVSFNGNLTLIEVDTDGTAAGSNVTDTESINVGGTPLDVTALGNSGIPGSGGVGAGTLFVAQIGANAIAILEPGDPPGIDLDADNDGVLDINDPLQFDPTNGTDIILEGGETLFWDINPANGVHPGPGSEYNIGFTGWMINGASEINPDVLTENPGTDLLTDLDNTIRGGAPGVLQIKEVTDGDAYLTTNSQDDALQTGFTPSESVETFTIRVPIFNPFSSVGIDENFASVGFALGDGTQNNYLKVVVGIGGNQPQLQVFYEENDQQVQNITVNGDQDSDFAAAASNAVTGNAIFNLYLTVDLSVDGAATAQAFYNYELSPGSGMVLAQPKAIGGPIALEGEVLKAVLGEKTLQDEGGNDIASSAVVTMLATSTGPESPFAANFADLEISSTEKQVAPAATDDEAATMPDQPVVINIAELLANDTDANPNDTLEIVSVQNETNGTAVLNDAGTQNDTSDDFITFTPTNGFEGTATFEYTVEDSSGLTDTATVSVTVSDVEVLYRVNAGGSEVAATDGGPNWAANTGAGAQTGDGFSNNTGNLSSPSAVVLQTTGDNAVPDYVPLALFDSERWDPPANPEMAFAFEASVSGTYTVNLFMADGFAGTAAEGARVFDISIEDVLVQDDLDLIQTLGDQTAGMFSYDVEVTDGTLNILWEHVTENPLINAIEIIGPAAAPGLPEISILGADQTISEDGASVDISIASDIQVPNGEQVDVTIEIASGTAVAGEDFEYTGGGTLENGVYTHTLPIAGGSSDLTLSIGILDDLLEESTEAFTVTITGVSANATIGTATQNVSILDDDTVINPGDVLYRVNAGGAETADPLGGLAWSEDQAAETANGAAQTGTPSPFLNLTSPATDTTFGAALSDAFVNNTTLPDSLFSTERYSVTPSPDNVSYDFSIADGNYTVNLYAAEIWTGAQDPGVRVFDVEIEGLLAHDDVDLTADFGWNTVGVLTYNVAVTDGNLDIDFLPGVQNPKISAIEIIAADDGSNSIVSVGAPTPNSAVENGDTDSTTLIFPVTFDALPSAYTEVAYEVDINGVVTTGTLGLSVLDGEISVNVPNDDIENGTETVTVTLTGIVEGPAIIGNASATGSVTEDETTPPVPGEIVAAINSGGPALTDAVSGIEFSADEFFTTPSDTFTDSTGGNGLQPTLEGTAFETERYGGDFSYAIPVAPGVYDVDLLFAEIFASTAGVRQFDVLIEGQLVLDEYDILAENGGDINQTLIETIANIDPTTDDDDANINIQFVLDPGADNAKISGIVVRNADTTTYEPPADDLFGTAVEIADTGDAPSGPVLLAEGSNVMSATQEGDGDGLNGVRDRDYFTVTIPEGYQLSGLNLDGFTNANEMSADGFLAFQQGAVVTVNPLTGENVDDLQGAIIYGAEEVDGDLLALMRAGFNDPQTMITLDPFDQALTGTWTFWLNQGAGPSTATLDFQITPYPTIEIGNAADIEEGGDDDQAVDTLLFPVTATPIVEGDITVNVTIDLNGVQTTEDRVVTFDASGDGTIAVEVAQDDEDNGPDAVTVTLNSVAGTSGELGTTVSGTGNVTEDDTAPIIPGDVVSAVNAGGSTAIDGTAFGFTGTFETDTSDNPNAVFTSFAQNQTNNSGANDAGVFVGELPNEVFFTERWSSNLQYDLALEDGQYIVELYFAETYLGLPGGGSGGGVGGRIFDVAIEGELVIDNIDLFDEGDGIIGNGAGQAAVQIVKTFVVDVADGNLDIDFTAVADNAKISAIIVREVDDGIPDPAVLSITAQGDVEETGDNATTTPVVFDLTFDTPPTESVDITYSVSVGGVETQTNVALTLGTSDGQITVDVPNDDLDNGAEAVLVTITSISTATDTAEISATDGSATASVTEDDIIDTTDLDEDGLVNAVDPAYLDDTNGLSNLLEAGQTIGVEFDEAGPIDPLADGTGVSGVAVNPDETGTGDDVDPYLGLTTGTGVIENGLLTVATTNGDSFDSNNASANNYGFMLNTSQTDEFTVSSKIVMPEGGLPQANFAGFGIQIGDGTQESYIKVARAFGNGNKFDVRWDNDDAQADATPGGGQAQSLTMTEAQENAAAYEILIDVDRSDPDNITVTPRIIALDESDAQIGAEIVGQAFIVTGDIAAAINGLNPSTGANGGGLFVGAYSTDVDFSGDSTPSFDASWDYIRVTSNDPIPDTTAPTAVITPVDIVTESDADIVVEVTYADETLLNDGTIDISDVTLTGEGLTEPLSATGFSVVDGVATYTFAAPEGGWAEGDFTATVGANTVLDGVGNGVAVTTASISVDLPDPVLVSIGDAPELVEDGDTGATMLAFPLALSEAAEATLDLVIEYSINGGETQTLNLDGTVFDTDGVSTAMVPVPNDDADTGADSVSVELISVGTEGFAIDDTNSTGTGSVTEDDVIPLPDITVGIAADQVSVAEAELATASFTVTLSEAVPEGETVDVTYTVGDAGDTATEGTDYVAQSGTLSFSEGETTQQITVALINDDVTEVAETFSVVITGATIGAEALTVETPSASTEIEPEIQISLSLQGGQSTALVEEFEDTLTLTVELSEAADEDITISYQPSGTATDEDFELAPPLAITIPAGETTGSVFLSILDDALIETQETLTVTLSGASSGSIDVTNGSISFTIDSGDTEPPVTGDPITLEAEDFTNLDQSAYFAQGSSAASSNELIRLNSTDRTEVSTDLPEGVTPGVYQVAITYFDENDGQSLLEAAIDGQVFGTIVMSNDGPGNAAQSANLRTVVFSGVEIDDSALFSLFGTRDAGEFVRVDKVEFTRTGDVATNQPPTGTDIQDQAVNEGADVNIVFDYTDPEDDTLLISAELDGGLPLPEWLTFADTGITGTAPADAVGQTLDIVVTIDDGNGNVVTDAFALSVNDATGPIPSVSTGGTAGNQDDLTITVTFDDETGIDPITIDATDLLVEGPDNATYPASLAEYDPETGIATFTVPVPEGGFPPGEYGVSMIEEAVDDTLGNTSAATAPVLLVIEDTSAIVGANLDEDFDDDGTINSEDTDIDEDGIANTDDAFAYDATNGDVALSEVGSININLTDLVDGDSPFTAGFTGVMQPFSPTTVELDYATNNGAQIVTTGNGNRLVVESSPTDTDEGQAAFTFGAKVSGDFTLSGTFDNPYFGGAETPANFEQYGLIIGLDGGTFVKFVTGSPGADFELSGKTGNVNDVSPAKTNDLTDKISYAATKLDLDVEVTATEVILTGTWATLDAAGSELQSGALAPMVLTSGALFDAIQAGDTAVSFGITHTQTAGVDDPFPVSLTELSLVDGNLDLEGPTALLSIAPVVDNLTDIVITATFEDDTGVEPTSIDGDEILLVSDSLDEVIPAPIVTPNEDGTVTYTYAAPEGGWLGSSFSASLEEGSLTDTSPAANTSAAGTPVNFTISDPAIPGTNLDEDFDTDGMVNSLDGDIDEDGIANADDRFAYDDTNQGVDLATVGQIDIDIASLAAGDSPFKAGFTGVNPTFEGVVTELDYATNNGAQIVETANGNRLQVESSATDTNNASAQFTFAAQTGSEFTFTGKFDNPYFGGAETPASSEQYGLIITTGGGDFLKLVAGSPGAAFELSGKTANVGFDGADLKVTPAGVDIVGYASVELSIDTVVTPTAVTFTGNYTTFDEAGNVISSGSIGTKTLTEGDLFDSLQGGADVPAFGITHSQIGGANDPFTVSLESMSLVDGNLDVEGPTANIIVDDIADGDSDVVVTVSFDDATAVDPATIDGDEITLFSNDQGDIIPAAQFVDNLDGTFTYTFPAPDGGWNGTAFSAFLAAGSTSDTLGNLSDAGTPVEFGREDIDPTDQILENLEGVDNDGSYGAGDTGSVILTVLDGNENVRTSNFGANSFELTNTGDKQIAAVFIDVRDALYGDSVFDFDGSGGDTTAKVFAVNNESGDGTGALFEGSDSYFLEGSQPIPNTSGDGVAAAGGFRGLLIKFDGSDGGFSSGELVGFSGDMDPNSIAGLAKGGTFGVDPGAIDGWDVGGVSGAELIGSKFTVVFDDGTTAEGYLHSDNSLAGSVGEAVQGRATSTVNVLVNGFDSTDTDATYGGIEPVIVVTGTPGDTVRVVMSQGFNPVTNESGGVADIVAERLATQHPDFEANNALNFQTVDVVIGANGTATVPAGTFDYNDQPSNVDNPDLGVTPIAVTAAVIVDATDTSVIDKVAVGPVADPVYLTNPTQTPVDPTPPAPEGYFEGIDTGGGFRFKIQIEDANIDNGGQNPGGDWVFVPDGDSTLGDAQGTGSYFWEFLGDGNLAPNAPQEDSILTFNIFIPEGEEGNYTLRLRAGRETGDPGDARNDVWLRIDGDAEALQVNETNSVSNDGFIKIFGNPTGNWGYAGSIDSVSEEEPNFAAVFELEAGFHTIQLAGRSPGFNIDFIELNSGGNPSVNAADSQFIATGDTAPVVNDQINDIALQVGDALSFAIPSDAFFDADGDTLFIDAPNLPTGFTFVNGVLTGESDLPIGAYPITITATDDDLNVAVQTFVVTVSEDLPVSDFQAIVEVSTDDIELGSSLNSPDLETDKVVQIRLTVEDGVSNVTSVESAFFNFVSDRGQSGTTTLNFNARPSYDDLPFAQTSDFVSNGQSVTISQAWADNETVSGLIDLAPLINDLIADQGPLNSGDVINLQLTGSGATRYIVQTTAVLDITGANGGTGGTNQAPVVASPVLDTEVSENGLLDIDLSNVFTDPDNDDLQLNVVGLPDGATFSGTSISGTPTESGVFTVTVTASDGVAATADVFILTVLSDADTEPEVNVEIPDQNVGLGEPFSFAVPANAFFDADGDTLTITSVNTPSGFSYNPNTDTFAASGNLDSGTYTLTVQAEDDDGNTVQQSFNVTVDEPEPNIAPVANDDSLEVDASASGSVNVLANDTDANDDILSVNSFGQGSNGAVVNLGGGNLQYTPNNGFVGNDSFNYTVSDGDLTSQGTISVTVSDPGAFNVVNANVGTELLRGTDGPDAYTFAPGTSVNGAIDVVLDWAPGDVIDLSGLGLSASDFEIRTISGGTTVKLIEGFGAGEFHVKINLNGFSQEEVLDSVIYAPVALASAAPASSKTSLSEPLEPLKEFNQTEEATALGVKDGSQSTLMPIKEFSEESNGSTKDTSEVVMTPLKEFDTQDGTIGSLITELFAPASASEAPSEIAATDLTDFAAEAPNGMDTVLKPGQDIWNDGASTEDMLYTAEDWDLG